MDADPAGGDDVRSGPANDRPGRGARRAEDRVVTLITGDRVILRGEQVSIAKGAGRERVTFESRRTGKEWTVIPSDVREAVRTGQLDKRLFDLDLLFRDGYDDAARGDIPLIVTGPSVPAARAKTVRALKSVTALAVPKQDAAAFLAQARQRKAGGKIWLDRKLRTSLDHSVPQIGAPAAWQAGCTGKGTDGYRGVAPDAKLLDGKVCDDFGDCSESAVLAGIEWAVAQHAPVVNLSLGSPGGDETDPRSTTARPVRRPRGGWAAPGSR